MALAFLALVGTSTHTVRKGETLSQIAAQHGVSVSALVQANGISDPNLIIAGAQLMIPSASGDGSGGSGGGSYVVERGDTLAGIARKFGTSVANLVSANGLRNANFILVGQTLAVPAGGGGRSAIAAAADGVPSGGSHVVRAGDTLAGIARQHGITVEQIAAANGITDGRIYTGQRLLLSPPASAPVASGGGTYVVEKGDTLAAIARRFGTTVNAIVQANGLSNPNAIVAGRELKIPAGGGSGAVVCPVAGARFMNDWGFPRSGSRFHEGNDLFAPRGTPFVAPVSGTVVQLVGKIGGNQVKLMGDDGVGYYGTHLDAFGTAGHVGAGEVIGYVGNSGNAVGGPTHLHFEVHPGGGAAVNPYPVLVAAC